jgi:hypothetical protein
MSRFSVRTWKKAPKTVKYKSTVSGIKVDRTYIYFFITALKVIVPQFKAQLEPSTMCH